jgi:formyltetrahydrofolate hydrolase
MWDEMVTVIVIENNNKIVTTFEATQIDVEVSSVIRAPKKQEKEATIGEKREQTIDNCVMKKYLKGLDETKCKHFNESIKNKFSNASPLETSLLKG